MKIFKKLNLLLERQASKFYKEKRFEKAIFIYDQILKLDSENARIWNNKGLCLQNLNRHVEAVACYNKALNINPKYSFAWSNKGVSLIKLTKYEEALPCFFKTLEIDPQNSIALYNKTICENELIKIREDARKKAAAVKKEYDEWRESELIRVDKEKKKQEQEDIRKKAETAKKEYDEWREKEKKKLELVKGKLDFDSNYAQLIHEIELSADERPCPKCNELDVWILFLSPNARSLSARCCHCRHDYRIKMEPDDPQRIIYLLNSFLEGRSAYAHYGENDLPFWRMEIKKRQSTNQRKPIPTSVKKAVWKRDGGKCVSCGSDVDLEYDHIIPVAKGGSSTIQNIQILCKKCNRKKSASIE